MHSKRLISYSKHPNDMQKHFDVIKTLWQRLPFFRRSRIDTDLTKLFELLEQYMAFKNFCLALDTGNITKVLHGRKIFYKIKANPKLKFASIRWHYKGFILVGLWLKYDQIKNQPKFAKKTRWGTQLRIRTRKELEASKPFIRQAFEACR